MGDITHKKNPVAFFKNQNTLILRHELSCRSVTSIFSPGDNSLILIPLGTSRVYTFKSLNGGMSTAVTDPVLFPKLFDREISNASFFPRQKVVIHFDSKPEERYNSELSLKCLKCGKIFYEIHVKSESCFIVPRCECCEKN